MSTLLRRSRSQVPVDPDRLSEVPSFAQPEDLMTQHVERSRVAKEPATRMRKSRVSAADSPITVDPLGVFPEARFPVASSVERGVAAAYCACSV